jgi:alkanesulfonate monooxygenase SsuD/methylene tetrahydromethanopterin reductase-like flavin-dependent oxidoreductase (luciferase family)
VRATPTGETAPDVWLLGSSGESASLAAALGLPFMFAHFINGYGGPSVTRGYQDQFIPSPHVEEPRSSVAIFVICADTLEQAEKLTSSDVGRERMILGNPEQVKEQLERLAEDYRVDEVMINTITGDYEARVKSYRMISERFDLKG